MIATGTKMVAVAHARMPQTSVDLAGVARIADLDQAPVGALEKFYEQMFPTRASFLKRHRRWLYRQGAYDWASPPLVALAGDQVVGHIGVMPVVLACGGTERAAVWLIDLAITPQYQRQRVGQALLNAAMARYTVLLGLPNERSLGTVLKCGWRLRSNTHSFQLLLRPEQHRKLRGTRFAPLSKVAGLATRVLWQARALTAGQPKVEPASSAGLSSCQRHDSERLLCVRRSSEFFQWRILGHPHAEEHFVLRERNKRGCGAIACLSGEGGRRRLHLLSLFGEVHDARALARFFAAVINWAARTEVYGVLLVTSEATVARVARWWLPLKGVIPLVFHSTDPLAEGWLSAGDHLWECIDADLDLL
jgi:GNAT superfamily N-acetyltransferase